MAHAKKAIVYNNNELIEVCVTRPRRHAKRVNGHVHFTNLQNIWAQLAAFLDDNMSTGKGVMLGDMGAFTWRNCETQVARGTTAYHRAPVLILRDDFIQNNCLRPQGENIYIQLANEGSIYDQKPFVPMVAINYNTLAYETGLDRDILRQYIDDLMLDFQDLIRDGEEVNFDFGVATLQAKKGRITCVYSPDFIKRTSETPGDYTPRQFQHLVTERIGDSVVVHATTISGTATRNTRAAISASQGDPRDSLPPCDQECLNTIERIVAGLEVADNELLRRVGSSAVMAKIFNGANMRAEYIQALNSMLEERGMSLRQERPPESFREHVRGPCTYFRLFKGGLSYAVIVSLAEPQCSFSFWKRGAGKK